MRSIRVPWGWWAISVMLAGCFELPAIATAVCGNGILDPGEDCERVAAADGDDSALTCTATCRLACEPRTPGPACPAGWSCGLDRVCRHGDATFDVGATVTLPSSRLTSANIDGDGRTQVIAASSAGVNVLRDVDGLQTSHLRISADGVIATGPLRDDGTASLVASSSLSLSGWNASFDQGFAPILAIEALPGVEVVEPDARLMAVRTDVTPAIATPFLISDGEPTLVIRNLATEEVDTGGLGGGPLAALLPPAIANLDVSGAPGDEVALAFAGARDARILRVVGSRLSLASVVSTALPIERVMFADVDDDDRLDLVLTVTQPDARRVAVARGDGAGGFAIAALDPRFQPDRGLGLLGLCSSGGSLTDVRSPPLLGEDLDGDGLTDYVVAEGIVRGRVGARYCRASFTSEASAAVTLDANGDGRRDVAVIDAGVVGLFTQSSDHRFDYHAVTVPDGGLALRISVGEFDGDYLDDLVIETARGASTDTTPTLWIAHGTVDLLDLRTSPGPDLQGVTTIAAGPFSALAGSVTGLTAFGHDAGSDQAFVAKLQSTPGGLGSRFDLPVGALASEIRIGRFTAASPRATDLLVIRGGRTPAPTVELWPAHGPVLRHWGRASAPLPGPIGPGPFVHGDTDGDGLDELGWFDDSRGALQRLAVAYVAPSAPSLEGDLAATPLPELLLTGYASAAGLQLVDLDADGRLEWVGAFATGGVVVVRDPGGPPVVITLDPAPAKGAIALNLDDDPELEVAAVTDTLRFYDLGPEGGIPIGAIEGAFDGAELNGTIAAADLDGDGVAELIVGLRDGTARVLRPRTNTSGSR